MRKRNKDKKEETERATSITSESSAGRVILPSESKVITQVGIYGA